MRLISASVVVCLLEEMVFSAACKASHHSASACLCESHRPTPDRNGQGICCVQAGFQVLWLKFFISWCWILSTTQLSVGLRIGSCSFSAQTGGWKTGTVVWIIGSSPFSERNNWPFLKGNRLQSGMIQKHLARQLQVTSAAVSTWAHGKLSYHWRGGGLVYQMFPGGPLYGTAYYDWWRRDSPALA